jgi:hypothetical protein
MSRDSLKQALLSSLLGALGVADTKSTPHMQILEEGPPLAGRGGIPEGPVHLIQYGTDNYHCTVVVSTSHGLPPAVLAKLFRENFQHGLERLDKPEGSMSLTLPYIVRWEVMGTIESMAAVTFCSYGISYTDKEKEELTRNFEKMNTPEVQDDTTSLH